MRIIGGRARGTVIQAPEGLDTRPTLDRVRENIYNLLQFKVPGARVLDLFAGSGAMAFESLSRGAAHAVLVDRDKGAIACIRKNGEKLRMLDRSTILSCDWQEAVRHLTAAGEKFDLIFLDPPYALQDLSPVTEALLPLMAEGCTLAVEHRAGQMPKFCNGLLLADQRRYGIAGVCLLRKAEKP